MRKLTTEEFIDKSMSIHGKKYDYSLVDYKTSHTKVKIICNIHGIFEQKPNCHLTKRGCVICANIKRGATSSNTSFRRKYNNLIQPIEYKLIPLTQGKFAKVSNEDFEILRTINWQFHPRKYATCNQYGKMHRFIMKCPTDKQVDHINHDTLDNRRCNLRICTAYENGCNTRPVRNSTSIYKGVSYFKRNKKWRSTIRIEGKFKSLGYFFNEVEAAKAYDISAIKYFKDFAYLNFPDKKDEYLRICDIKKEIVKHVASNIT